MGHNGQLEVGRTMSERKQPNGLPTVVLRDTHACSGSGSTWSAELASDSFLASKREEVNIDRFNTFIQMIPKRIIMLCRFRRTWSGPMA